MSETRTAPAQAALASGIGSWPGDDVREAVVAVRDLLSGAGIPYLPELPGRGPGADLVGRGAGLLVDLPVDLRPSGWRFVDRPGNDATRTAARLREDLDELAEAYDGYDGPLKIQLAGPFTLAAAIERPRGERAASDPGLVRDIVASLAEGLGAHLADVERLVPGAEIIVQLDEPSLPAVLEGRLPTASGHGRVRAVDPHDVTTGLRSVLAAAGERRTVVHCCDHGIPLPLLRSSGASGISMDVTALGPTQWESVAATVESGTTLYAGVLPAGAAVTPTSREQAVETVVRGWDRTGLEPFRLRDIVVTPTCGLAGLSFADAVRSHETAIDVAAELTQRST